MSQQKEKHSAKQPICASIPEYNKIISTAFQTDVEIFLLQFEKQKSLKFEDFSTVWKNMMFSYIFSEQLYYTFINDFMDNVFFILKKFLMFPRSIFTEAGTLYLLYAIYFKQTVKEWVKIRLTSEEYLKIQNLLSRLLIRKELEPLFVYNKLLKVNAFEYVFQRKIIAPELKFLKNSSEFVDDTFQSVSSNTIFKELKDLLNEDNFLEHFTKTTDNYRQALSRFSVQYPGLGDLSSTIKENLNALLDDNSSDMNEALDQKSSYLQHQL